MSTHHSHMTNFISTVSLVCNRLFLYPAYSRGDNPQYVQEKLYEEAATVREILANPLSKVYVCGNPDIEFEVRETLISIFEKGSSEAKIPIPGMGIVQATMTLSRMKLEDRYITEVYGKASPRGGKSEYLGGNQYPFLTQIIHSNTCLFHAHAADDSKLANRKAMG